MQFKTAIASCFKAGQGAFGGASCCTSNSVFLFLLHYFGYRETAEQLSGALGYITDSASLEKRII